MTSTRADGASPSPASTPSDGEALLLAVEALEQIAEHRDQPPVGGGRWRLSGVARIARSALRGIRALKAEGVDAGPPSDAVASTNCEDCPPVGYPTDDTRCLPCPRRSVDPAKAELVEALRKTLAAIDGLMAESHGVVGLHLNGDIATWDELVAGGKYEDWLADLEIGRAIIAKTEI